MIDRIVGHGPAPVVVQRLAGIRIDVKPGKIAGNIQPDAVSEAARGEYGATLRLGGFLERSAPSGGMNGSSVISRRSATQPRREQKAGEEQ